VEIGATDTADTVCWWINTLDNMFTVRTMLSILTATAIATQHDETGNEQTEQHHVIVFCKGRRR